MITIKWIPYPQKECEYYRNTLSITLSCCQKEKPNNCHPLEYKKGGGGSANKLLWILIC